MSEIEKKLTSMGLALPEVPAPAGSYLPAVQSGSYIYTSGQVPFVGGKLPAVGKVGKVGKVGAEVDPAQAKSLARTCALNALASVKAVAGDLNRVRRIVKVVGFVASAPDFTGQPGVVDGASDLLGDLFGDNGRHARSAVGVAVLPLDAPVEVEIICELAD
ncbi:RidA family protein [Streptomyces sp. NPDC005962]|uniref:RidA family protein n=1 Tax=Streptomyces sp. NPDC005962 TaxID=3154466 RepID=UPI0033D20DC9